MSLKLKNLSVVLACALISQRLFAQTYDTGSFQSGETVFNGNLSPQEQSGLYVTGTGASVDTSFTIDPTASTFEVNSVSATNWVTPEVTTSFNAGFGSSNQVNLDIKFNPLNFSTTVPLQPGSNPTSLSSESGYSEPTYSVNTLINFPVSNLNLTGTYTLTDSHGSTASGTFSDPLDDFIVFFLETNLQPTGYPSTVNLSGTEILSFQPASAALFVTTFDGQTVSPTVINDEDQVQYGQLGFGDSTVVQLAPTPEPSAIILIFLGNGAVLLSRKKLYVRQND